MIWILIGKLEIYSLELVYFLKRFNKCSQLVKLRFFSSYCLCFYDIVLWCNFSKAATL